MRILYATRHIDRPEAALLVGLQRRGFQVTVVCHPRSANLERLRASDIEPKLFEFTARLQPSAVRYLRKLDLAHSFDVIHAVASRALSSALFAARGLGVPVVGYRGTVGHLSLWDPGSWIAHRHPRVAKIICVSKAVHDYVAATGVPADRIVTIHKGHQPEWYTPVAPCGVRRGLGIPPGKVVISCAANERPHKGVHVLVEALHSIQRDDVHLLLIGSMGKRITAQVAAGAAHQRIHLLGFRTDAPAVIGESDIFVMPSTAREGFARAVIEAMSQKIPTVATTVGGLPEMISDGVHGYLVPPEDPTALAQALLRLIESPADRLSFGQAAWQRVNTELSVEHTIEKTAALYQELINRQRSAA